MIDLCLLIAQSRVSGKQLLIRAWLVLIVALLQCYLSWCSRVWILVAKYEGVAKREWTMPEDSKQESVKWRLQTM
eukprot:5898805-Karenia_brevis.AAC.1